MNGNKDVYDFICSLGGNCSAAHNLRYRDLRPASYPFDWTYFESDDAIYSLIDGFKTEFKNYMLKENLQELAINPSHPDIIQYKDAYGKIVWANHFSYKDDKNKNYNAVKKKYNKRFKRLLNKIKTSKKILFIFSASFYIKPDSFIQLLNTLQELYPNKYFEIKVVSFDCEKEEIFRENNLEIFYIKRKINDYDFYKTNYEWNFLDNIKYSKKRKRIKISLKLFCSKLNIEWSL